MNGLCYRFDPDTKEYIRPDQAQESPLEPGVWLWPANTTTDEPPAAVEGRSIHFIDGAWVYQHVQLPPTPMPATPAELKASALARINAAYQASVDALTAGYPAGEMSSWPKQEAEARAWVANAGASTPWMDAAAAARGITKDDLAARIISNADLFSVASGQLSGKRQKLRNQIAAFGDDVTQAQLAAIQW